MRVARSFVLSASLLSPSYSQAPAQSAQEPKQFHGSTRHDGFAIRQLLCYG
jgi:hypothetical protein